MHEAKASVAIGADDETENVINEIFRQLSDHDALSSDLQRFSAHRGGVARELITTVAVITASTPIILRILGIFRKYLDDRSQKNRITLIISLSREDPQIASALVDLEKHRISVEAGEARMSSLISRVRKKEA